MGTFWWIYGAGKSQRHNPKISSIYLFFAWKYFAQRKSKQRKSNGAIWKPHPYQAWIDKLISYIGGVWMLCDHKKFWTALRLMLQLVQNSSSSYVCLQFLLASLSHPGISCIALVSSTIAASADVHEECSRWLTEDEFLDARIKLYRERKLEGVDYPSRNFFEQTLAEIKTLRGDVTCCQLVEDMDLLAGRMVVSQAQAAATPYSRGDERI